MNPEERSAWDELVARLEAESPGRFDDAATRHEQGGFPWADSPHEGWRVGPGANGADPGVPPELSDARELSDDAEDAGFDPGEPEPLVITHTGRAAAWVGGVTLPLLMMLLLIFFRSHVPAIAWWAMILVAAGCWVYLIWSMPREPRDPWDDGARV